jgi:hypothetical protein
MHYIIRAAEEGPERGPYSWHELRMMLHRKDLSGNELVRDENSSAWRALRDLEAEQTAQAAERDRAEIAHASHAKKRGGSATIAVGSVCLIVGVVADMVMGVAHKSNMATVWLMWGGIALIVGGFVVRRR